MSVSVYFILTYSVVCTWLRVVERQCNNSVFDVCSFVEALHNPVVRLSR